jgi:AcrR family transcriptional regulator
MGDERGISRRQARDQRIRAENMTRILNGAEEVFAEKGYDGARMVDLAEAAGLAKANLYYYFGDKKTIYQNVIEELLARWDGALHHISEDKEPGQAIADYIRAKLRYSQEHSAASKIFAKEIIGGSRFLSSAKRRAIRVITREKGQVIEKWIEEGKMDPVDPYHFFFHIWGATQYYADFDAHIKNILEQTQLSDATYDAAIETITGIVLKGCGIKA